MSVFKKILYGVLFTVLFTGLWNLFEYLFTTFISRSSYVWKVSQDLIYPIVIGFMVYLLLFIVSQKRKSKTAAQDKTTEETDDKKAGPDASEDNDR